MWLNAIGSTTSHEGAVITSFHSWYREAAWPFLTYSLTGRQPYSFPLFHFLFLYASLSFPSCLAKFILNSLLSLRGRKYSKTIPAALPTNFAAYRPNLLALDFSPNDPFGSRSNGGHLENSSINNRRTAIVFIHSLPSTTQLPRGETLFHLPPINILEIFKDFSATTRKYSKTFSPAKLS